MNKLAELSIFFPAYNEEANIRATVERALPVLAQVAERYEVMIVDDGSTDKTAAISEQLANEYPSVRLVSLRPNQGYGAALTAGFYNAKFEVIAYTDGDGQLDFGEITKFIAALPNADVVIGYRIKRMDPKIRLLVAFAWKMLILLFFQFYVRDVDCGFKMVRKKVIETIPHLESTRGGMINPELVIKSEKAGFRIAQVGVHHYPRMAGKPTGASIPVIITSFRELVKLRLKTAVTSQKKQSAPITD